MAVKQPDELKHRIYLLKGKDAILLQLCELDSLKAPFMRVLRLPQLAELPPIPESCPVLAQRFMDQGVDAQFAAFSGHLWLRWTKI